MITLAASTVTLIVQKAGAMRYIRMSSDSTTVTRLAISKEALEQSTGGYGVTAYQDVVIRVPAGQEIYAVSAGTPDISMAEATNPWNAIVLR